MESFINAGEDKLFLKTNYIKKFKVCYKYFKEYFGL